MAVNPITASMSIELPTPGQTEAFGIAAPGESWGELYNAGFNTVDQHDHTTGRGLAITSAAININGDLDFNTENLIGLRTARFDAISLGSLGVTDIGCLLVSSADLYYVDTVGNQVRMTSGGAIAGAPGSISGLAAPASASYASGPKLFSFESAADTVAGIACGPLVLTDSSVPNGKAASIQVPAGLVADYQLTLPGALPGHTQIATVTTAGVIALSDVVDNSTLQLSAGVMSIKDAGVTRPKLAAVGQQRSGSSNSFSTASATPVDVTGVTLSITTTGRPVMVILGPNFNVGSASGTWHSTVGQSVFSLLRDGVIISTLILGAVGSVPAVLVSLDTGASAAAHTYKMQASNTSGGSAVVDDVQLVAYEL